jgi:putative transposase
MILREGQELLFHSAPHGLWQFESLSSGEFFKWTQDDFKNALDCGEISHISTVASSSEIRVVASPVPSRESMLIGLTEHELRVQARNMFAYKTFQGSGLRLAKDGPQILELVNAACESAGFLPVTLRKLRRIHQEVRRHREILYACTPHRKGAEYDARNIDPRDEKLVASAIEEHYLKEEQPSIASAHRHYLGMREDDQRENGEIGRPAASLRTFERRVSRLESFTRVERREGTDEARRRHRVSRGIYSVVDPMEIGEMDDCYVPYMLVNDDYTHVLGIPRLSALRDRGTGYVPSFFVWCGEVCTFTSLATLRNLVTDKAALLEHAGLPPDAWLYTGPFATLATDRGRNLNAEPFVRAAVAMGSSVQFLPRRMPWRKPFIERLNGYVLEYVVKELPGRVFDDVQSFRSYKAQFKAVLPFSAFIRILVRFFVEVINGVPRPGHRTTPTEEMRAWLLDHPPAIPCNRSDIDLLTAMPLERTVSQEGIRWENLHFVSDDLADMVRRIGSRTKVTVFVNPSNLSEVSVVDPVTKQRIKAYCTWPDYANGLSLPEHQLLCRELRAHRERIRLAALIRLQREIAKELEAGRLGKKLSPLARKAERLQYSSASVADKEAGLPAPTPDPTSEVLTQLLF